MRTSKSLYRLLASVLVLCFAVKTFPIAVAADGGGGTGAHSAQTQPLKEAAKDEEVQEELAEPDGVSIDLSDPENWKIFARGSASFQFNDSDERREAVQEATLDAKASLAKYIEEKLSVSTEMDALVEKKSSKAKGSNGSSSSATSERTKTTLTSLRNSASEILAGKINLESSVSWPNAQGSGTATVLIGQSHKACRLQRSFEIEQLLPSEDMAIQR